MRKTKREERERQSKSEKAIEWGCVCECAVVNVCACVCVWVGVCGCVCACVCDHYVNIIMYAMWLNAYNIMRERLFNTTAESYITIMASSSLFCWV